MQERAAGRLPQEITAIAAVFPRACMPREGQLGILRFRTTCGRRNYCVHGMSRRVARSPSPILAGPEHQEHGEADNRDGDDDHVTYISFDVVYRLPPNAKKRRSLPEFK